MKFVHTLFNRLFRLKPQQPTPDEVEILRLTFKDRYQQFKLLLNANNKALEVMGQIEQALEGTTPFGMQFIRSRCTRVSTNVFQIVKHINALAPGRYTVLYERFKQIQRQINPYVHPPVKETRGPLTMALPEVDREATDLTGPKMAQLAELAGSLALDIPNGFVITSAAYDAFMRVNELQAEINRRIQTAELDRLDRLYALSTDLQQLIIQTQLPRELEQAIDEAYDRLRQSAGLAVRLAVRSSSLGEDLAEASFAGQYRSILNVGRANLVAAYKEVVASKYSLQAITYRLNRGIRDEEVPMCVGCLQMVDAVAGGVLYTRNPVDIRDDKLIINAAWGLPKSVVDGTTATDQFEIRRGSPLQIINRRIPEKVQQFVCYPDEGVCRMTLTGETAALPSISDDQALALAELGMRIDSHYGAAQDIEWAITADGTIVMLQCRQLKQAAPAENRDVPRSTRWPICLHGGNTASAGVGSGPVFIVSKEADALRFPKGAVLVASQASPRWATLLNRAAAVITEQGSLAGHLANVAREFHIPALFGIETALKELSNGQLVTVDADGRTVYDGIVAPLLQNRQKPLNLMAGSRVYALLKGAAAHIVPLNLLNPDGLEFKAERCRTFHDITRFCHEKAVHEMFRFGKEHHFPERSSKQLHSAAAMQWWVLNLDDGFKNEVEGQFVTLDNIASIPMLALWEGITAYPWQGPPPMDGKGFMSVMFQATANRALLPTVKSSMANRNYFMISKNFCSLQSRLGFHFSIVEALVSERTTENYINFHFKGGGADLTRRRKRVYFIGDILENYNFRVTINEDALIARMESRSMADMQAALKIVGYLSIHTRQLDMIMSNPNMMRHYSGKLDREIKEMLGKEASPPSSSEGVGAG